MKIYPYVAEYGNPIGTVFSVGHVEYEIVSHTMSGSGAATYMIVSMNKNIGMYDAVYIDGLIKRNS